MSRTQRELKAMRQQQREDAAARQRARDRRNLFIIGGILGTAAIVILLVALALRHQEQQSTVNRLSFQTVTGTIGQEIPDEGPATHVDPSTTPTYKFYPPTSGPHYSLQNQAPVPWQTIGDLVEGQLVHNLEHGGIAILYNCPSGDDCTTLKTQLENYVKNLDPAEPQFGKVKLVMTPYSKGMQQKIALVDLHFVDFLYASYHIVFKPFYET